MPDDLTAHQLELLRKLTGKLDRLLDRSAQDAEAAQLARSQLDALGKKQGPEDERTAGQLRNGMQVNLAEFSNAPLVKVFASPTELIAIAKRVAGTLMQPHVVIG